MKDYIKKEYLNENMMGPNCLLLLEELMQNLSLKPGARILDLGCGKGLTSMWLADRFDATIFAVDLWIPATENFIRFKQMGFGDRIIPVHADATNLPFAEEYFDAAISVDSYHYFGMDKAFMDSNLAPLVKKGGDIAIAVPGLKHELGGVLPGEMALSWTLEQINTIRSCEWWREIIQLSTMIENFSVVEMRQFEECWKDWLACENEYAVSDRPAMNAGAGKYMNFVSITCKRRH